MDPTITSEGEILQGMFPTSKYQRELPEPHTPDGMEIQYGTPRGNCDLYFYRMAYDQLTDTGKDDFFKVRASDLNDFIYGSKYRFSWKNIDPSLLRNMLADAVMCFKLHNTWQAYICPRCDCLRWFPDDDSLVLHLMYEHCINLPFLQQNLTEERWCSEALRSTVWEPIDVRAALSTLSTINSSLDTDHLRSLDWPLSKNYRREILLLQLKDAFQVLLDSPDQDSFTMRSGGSFRALLAAASEHILRRLERILRHHGPMNILPLPFRALLHCSPLSFCFMEVRALRRFVTLVEGMCDLTRASETRKFEYDVNWSKSKSLHAVSFSTDHDSFVLDGAELDEKDVSLWLFQAPYFPTIRKLVPIGASEILQMAEEKAASISECLRTLRARFGSKSKLLTSCLKIFHMAHWPMPLLESPLNFKSDAANVKDMCASSCSSFSETTKLHRSKFGFRDCPKLIKLTLELQLFELQSAPGDVKEEAADEGNIMEGSQEEHLEGYLRSKVKGETAAEDGSDMMMPDTSSYKTSEESKAKPVAIPESDAEPELKAESESQCSQEVLDCFDNDINSDYSECSDSDSLSESEGEDEDFGSEMKGLTETMEFSEMKDFSIVVQLMKKKLAWEIKENDLFFCMTINDVVNHCRDKFGLQTAHNIWGWKTDSAGKYWRCFVCNKRFPDQESHMLHLESNHDLGIAWDFEWLVPSQVQKENQPGVNEGFVERTDSLNDSLTVDCTYRRFVVEMEKFGSLYQREEEGVQNADQFWQIVEQIQQQIHCLVEMFDPKSKQCLTSEIGELDAEIVQKCAEFKTSKQNLSNLCISDYKSEIFPCIRSFMQKPMECGFRSWPLQRLNEFLSDLNCPDGFLPDSFSVQLESPGKVIINMEEGNAGISFAWVGIRLGFTGDASLEEELKEFKGTFIFSGILKSQGGMVYHHHVILENKESEMTDEMFCFRDDLKTTLALDLQDLLYQFQAECRVKLQG